MKKSNKLNLKKKAWDNPQKSEDYHPGSNTGPIPHETPMNPSSLNMTEQKDTYFSPSLIGREPEESSGGGEKRKDESVADDDPWGQSNMLRPLKRLLVKPMENDTHDFNSGFDTEYTQRQFGLNLRKRKVVARKLDINVLQEFVDNLYKNLIIEKEALSPGDSTSVGHLGFLFYEQLDNILPYDERGIPQLDEEDWADLYNIATTLERGYRQSKIKPFSEALDAMYSATLNMMEDLIDQSKKENNELRRELEKEELKDQLRDIEDTIEEETTSYETPQIGETEIKKERLPFAEEKFDLPKNMPPGIARLKLRKKLAALKKMKKEYLDKLWDGTKVYIVDGAYVRDNFDTDFVWGGHHYAYPKFIPKNEIWVENMQNVDDQKDILAHELFEWFLMKYEKKSYEDAHKHALDIEQSLRDITIRPKKKSKLNLKKKAQVPDYFKLLEKNPPGLEHVCSWCQSVYDINTRLPTRKLTQEEFVQVVSHGICQKCADKQIEEARKLREQREKQGTLAVPIRESLDYPHSWNKDKKKKPLKELKEYEKELNKDTEYPVNVFKKMKEKTAQFDQMTVQTSDIPEEVISYIKEVQKKIKPEQYCTEEDEKGWVEGGKQKLFHTTILYGIKNTTQDNIKEIVDKHVPCKVTTDKLHYFEKNEKYSVLVLRLNSKDLTKLHDDMKDTFDNEDSYPEYKPHVTIAYLNKGERVENSPEVPTIEWEVKEVEYTTKSGEIKEVKTSWWNKFKKFFSILDEPRACLDPSIWSIGSEDLPFLKPEVKIHIIKNFFDYIERFGGYKDPAQWVKNMFYTGSTATYTYQDKSDVDIHILIDWEDMAKANPDKARKDLQQMWQELHDTFWWTLNKIKLPGTKHLLTYYVVPPGEEHKILEQKEEMYDMGHDVWLVPPLKTTKVPEEILEPAIQEASEIMTKLDQEISDVRKEVIDYNILLQSVSKENASHVYQKLFDKIKTIDTDIKKIKEEYDLLKQKRRDAFENNQGYPDKNNNYSVGNIVFKLLERYRYINVLRRIKEITDNLDVKYDQIPEIAKALRLNENFE